MSDWRALKAARERREGKQAAAALERARRELGRVTRERDAAINGPLNRLSTAAMEQLAYRTSLAIEVVSEERLREALKRIQETGFARMKISQRPHFGVADDVVLSVDIPAYRCHLMAELPLLRWER